MEYGIAVVLIILLLTAYVIVQETRAQLHWRGLVEAGDVDAVRQLVEVELESWRTERVPKGTPALLWHAVQTVSLTDLTSRGVRVNCSTEGEYAQSNGARVEVSSPLSEGMKTTKKLAEMLLYDVPNVKLDDIQVDVFTSFREASGRADALCILSTRVDRSSVASIDWDEISPADFVALNDGKYAAATAGAVAVEPLAWVESPARST